MPGGSDRSWLKDNCSFRRRRSLTIYLLSRRTRHDTTRHGTGNEDERSTLRKLLAPVGRKEMFGIAEEKGPYLGHYPYDMRNPLVLSERGRPPANRRLNAVFCTEAWVDTFVSCPTHFSPLQAH